MGTAHWGEDGIYWRWSDGGVEATAFALRALLAIDPQNKLVEPVSNWLIKNRRGAQWSNTRDTAITVLTMNDYLRASGELASDLEYELLVNGQSIAKKKVSSADILSAPSRFAIDPKLIRDGDNNVRIVRRSGKGPIYFAARASFFSLEEPITPAGSEIFVRRQYYKLVGRPTLLKGYVYEREHLDDGGSVKSGDRVQVVVTVEAKNNYEYLLFEDLKPAGLEAVEVRSGESLHAYELKSGSVDRKLGTNTAAARLTHSAAVTDDDHTGAVRAGFTRNCATAKWRCSLTNCPKAFGKLNTICAPKCPVNSTPSPSSARPCTSPKSAATARKPASPWKTPNPDPLISPAKRSRTRRSRRKEATRLSMKKIVIGIRRLSISNSQWANLTDTAKFQCFKGAPPWSFTRTEST